MEKEKDDLKVDETKVDNPSGDGQPEKKEEEEGKPKPLTPEEIEALRAENQKLKEEKEKAEEERNNYKQGLISKKAKEDESLFGNDEVRIEPKAPIAPVIDETEEDKTWKEVDRRSEEKARGIIAEKEKKEARISEQIAKKEWMKAHPELISNDALRQAIYSEYYPKHGKSVEGIKLDLDRAYNVYKIDNNIPLSIDKKKSVDLPNLPGGAGGQDAGLKKTGISAQEQTIKDKFGISDDNWKKYKEDVLNGKRQASQEVLQILKEEE